MQPEFKAQGADDHDLVPFVNPTDC